MSYWRSLDDTTISTEFTFGEIAVGNKYAVECADGKTAGWELVDAENMLAQIYDVTEGNYVPKAFVALMPGRDIFCGLFATGVIPTKVVTDAACSFWRVDY